MKKGLLISTELLTELFFLLIVTAVLLAGTARIKDDHLHNLRVESRDYAFLRDAALPAPHQLEYKYNTKQGIEIDINKEVCLVKANYIEEKRTPAAFHCARNSLIEITEEKLQNNVIKIRKNA